MKNSSDTNIGNRTRDLPACSTVPQPTVPPCTACYFVSPDIFPYLYVSKQSLSLLTEFTCSFICLSLYLPRKFSAAANVFLLPFIAKNSKHDARSWVKNSGFSYRLSQSVVLTVDNYILTGITDRCGSHDALHYGFCSAHFGKNKVLFTSFSRALHIQDVSKCFYKTRPLTAQFVLFTKLKFTRNTQNILRPNQYTHGHIWSWTFAQFHRSRGVCEWSDRPQNTLEMCLFIFNCSWID